MTEENGAPAGGGGADGAGQQQTFTQDDLNRIVAERVARERGKYADYADVKAKASKYDETVASQQSDIERAVEAAKRETETTVRTAVQRDRVLDRVEVLAAKDFADPEDARLRLAQRADEFVKDGSPDSDAIAAALKQLLAEKPHLAATATRPPRPTGSPGQGPRGDVSSGTDMNQLIRRAAGVA